MSSKKLNVGGFDYVLPVKPPDNQIYNYGLAKKDQKWKRIIPATDFDELERSEQITFIQNELKRRDEGFWFFNNGVAEYMTGQHYFYCNWWKIDVGYPEWREADRDFFYIWDLCVRDEDCFGLCLMGGRRMGKTYFSSSLLYEYASRHENAHVGIQSKTNRDAKHIFDKIVYSWKSLPFYLKPTDSGDTSPKQVLRFEEPGTRSTKAGEKKYKKVLNSKIDFEATVETAYDGTKLKRYYLDECGKTVNMNVSETWDIVKECLATGSHIIGKALLTTTVEEMEKKGGHNFKEIWDASDRTQKNSVGRTKSGLYRYFRPADHGLEGFIDSYGYSKKEQAREYIMKKREGLSGDALESEKRKYPLSETDSFRSVKGASLFDTNKIYDQIEYNDTLPVSTWIRGDFVMDPYDKRVRFHVKENGKFNVLRDELLNDDKSNAVSMNQYGYHTPLNKDRYVIGVDPFDHDVTADSRASDGASYVFKLFNPMDPRSGYAICEYCARPSKADIFFEDMLNQALYFGCEVLCENQKIGMIQHFRRNGYEKFLMKRPEATHTTWTKMHNDEYGIPNSPSMREYGLRLISTNVYDNTGLNQETGNFGNIKFNDLLRELIVFDTENWSPYDKTVAYIITLIATLKFEQSFKPKKDTKDISSFFRTFNTKKFRGLS